MDFWLSCIWKAQGLFTNIILKVEKSLQRSISLKGAQRYI